ncbi:MAG TPA: FAD:protein FMN transferase [Acidobacteriota bacterium]|nr:FAD:protein FMN transferase [Acidobacteriota bacterium]
MKCRFELVLAGEDLIRLRAVGEEALQEIESLGRKLNFFSPSSLLSRLNRQASAAPVAVDARLYQLLALCRHLHRETEGAFDPTVSPLLEAWGFWRREGRRPSPSELGAALDRVGFHKVLMDDRKRTVRLTGGATLNLSSIAKGYALDCAAEILREYGVERALLHGGTSSVLALDAPAPSGWRVEIADPRDKQRGLLRLHLRRQALSASGNHLNLLRLAESSGPEAQQDAPARIGHVIDPRSGRPVQHTLLAAVTTDGALPLPAARADAYATAALVADGAPPAWREKVGLFHKVAARSG